MGPKTKRCVLLFARSAAAEAKIKGLQGAQALFRYTAQRIARAVQALPDVDLVLVGPQKEQGALGADRWLPQRGRGFGERLQNALLDARAQGYLDIVAVGIDSPGLGVQELRAAFLALQDRPMVLGPSEDGGVYLLGVSGDPGALSAVRWQSEHVQADLLKTCPFAQLLLPLLDVDSQGDLRSLLSRSEGALRRLLKALLGAQAARPSPGWSLRLCKERPLHQARGPPARL